jgi:hypothetical protein
LSLTDDAARIAGGHAWSKHQQDFAGLTKDDVAKLIDRIMNHPSDSKLLTAGRSAFWDDVSRTVVIRDPNSPDMGTAFKPARGRAYYDNLS